jgi:hypothetical protein
VAQPESTRPADSAGVESLGSELLNDLAPNAFDPPSARETQQPKHSTNPPNAAEFRSPRFDDLGSDVGAPSGPLALAGIQQGMQQAASLLNSGESAADVPTLQKSGKAQSQVIAQLDQLIAELSKQCKSGNGKPAGAPPSASQQLQNNPADSTNAAARAKSAAKDSTTRLGEVDAQPAKASDLETSVERLWGHLPERSRQQMLQSFSEEFLPQYELEIEQYYRRLSEDTDAPQQE